MSIRLMHLADLHLGAPLSQLGDRAEQRARDLESALSRALAAAAEREVHAVAIAGDLFDSFNPPSDLIARVEALFEKTVQQGIPIILIPGTHDSHRYARCVYNQNEFSGADLLLRAGEPVLKRLNGHDAYFYGFFGDGKEDSAAFRRSSASGIHIALVHGSVGEGAHWSVGPRDFSLDRTLLKDSGFHYVALGHYHNYKEFSVGRTLAVYPGTLEGLKFGENGDRYLVIAEISENGASVEKIKQNRRTVSEINIDLSLAGIGCSEELEAIIDSHSDRDAIVKVSLTGTADFLPAKDELAAKLASRFFYLQIADETSVYRSDLVHSLKNENTVRGIFVRKMLDRIEKGPAEELATLELALRLGIEQFMRIKDENQKDID